MKYIQQNIILIVYHCYKFVMNSQSCCICAIDVNILLLCPTYAMSVFCTLKAYMNMYNYKSSAVAEMGDRLAT